MKETESNKLKIHFLKRNDKSILVFNFFEEKNLESTRQLQ